MRIKIGFCVERLFFCTEYCCLDLLHIKKLSQTSFNRALNATGFNYTIRIVADGAHGSYNKETGMWNGMIGELLSQARLYLLH